MASKAEKPWTGLCCSGCWNAKHKRCTCRCEGKFHGAGVHKNFDEGEMELMESLRQGEGKVNE